MKRWEPTNFPGPANGFGALTHRNFNQATGERGSWPDGVGYQQIIDEICRVVEGAGLTLNGAASDQLAQAVQKGMNFAVATGTANAWVVAPSLAVPAYAAGRGLNIIAPATNTATTVNMNVSGLGNRRIKKADGTDPAIGDLVAGKVYATIDDGTNIRVLTPLASEFIGTRARVVFTANGTLTMLSSLVKLMGWGGAAGGGGVNASGGAGGGGGGGEYREGLFSVVQGSNHAVAIGAGGNGGSTAGTNGANGGATSVGALLTANGGLFGAGASGTYGAGGLGGTGGDFAQPGGNGSNGGNLGSVVSSGTGGGSWMVPNHYIQFTAGAGGNGLFYAQGGNGATGGGGAAAGGNGRSGLVIAEFY